MGNAQGNGGGNGSSNGSGMANGHAHDHAHASDQAEVPEEEGLDPVLAGILHVMWSAAREPDARVLSLARISKRASVQMSVLRRVLTQLKAADLVTLEIEEDGRGSAELTAEGQALCDQLFDD